MAASIKLHVRAVRGPGFSVALPAGLATRVGDAKAAVEAAPQARRRAVAHLIHAGKVLADGLTLHDCGYSSSDFVVAVFTVRIQAPCSLEFSFPSADCVCVCVLYVSFVGNRSDASFMPARQHHHHHQQQRVRLRAARLPQSRHHVASNHSQ